MQIMVAKTGLEIFDACRAYGLGVLWNALNDDEDVYITDSGAFYVVESNEPLANKIDLSRPSVSELFITEKEGGLGWRPMFITYKSGWLAQVEAVKQALADGWSRLASGSILQAQIGTAEEKTMPGGLDPIAMKGLKGKTLTDCKGKGQQTKVDALNWALGCVGGAVAAHYKWQSTAAGGAYFVVLPTPEHVALGDFREIKKRLRERYKASHMSVACAAAHYAVLLADEIRRQRASKSRWLSFRFANLFYFALVQAGQQFKVGSGGSFAVNRLIEFASGGPAAAKALEVWDYLFRVGGLQGEEEVAATITEFVLQPSLRTYEGHVKAFLRRALRKGVKGEHLYDNDTVLEVMRYVGD